MNLRPGTFIPRTSPEPGRGAASPGRVYRGGRPTLPATSNPRGPHSGSGSAASEGLMTRSDDSATRQGAARRPSPAFPPCKCCGGPVHPAAEHRMCDRCAVERLGGDSVKNYCGPCGMNVAGCRHYRCDLAPGQAKGGRRVTGPARTGNFSGGTS